MPPSLSADFPAFIFLPFSEDLIQCHERDVLSDDVEPEFYPQSGVLERAVRVRERTERLWGERTDGKWPVNGHGGLRQENEGRKMGK